MAELELELRPSFVRHSGLITQDKLRPMTIIGCGAVGSNLALLAAKIGWYEFILWDSDTVASHNLPNQAYEPSHIGMNKVDALEDVLLRFNPEIKITKYNRFITDSEEDEGLVKGAVIVCPDTMAARKIMYKHVSYNTNVELVIDTRLSFDFAEIYSLDNLDANTLVKWKSTFRDDAEVEESACSLKIIPTLVNHVASYAVYKLVDYYSKETKNLTYDIRRFVMASDYFTMTN